MPNWSPTVNTALGEPEREYEVVVQPLIAPPPAPEPEPVPG